MTIHDLIMQEIEVIKNELLKHLIVVKKFTSDHILLSI
jgi:hypothetical protein